MSDAGSWMTSMRGSGFWRLNFQAFSDTPAGYYLTLVHVRPGQGSVEVETFSPVASPRDREFPRDLGTVIHKAIERDPGHRYQTAADLAEDLKRFIEDRPIRSRRRGRNQRRKVRSRPRRRRRHRRSRRPSRTRRFR